MPLEGVELLLQISNIPQIDHRIRTTCRKQELVQRIECYAVDVLFMRFLHCVCGAISLFSDIPKEEIRVISDRSEHVRIDLMPVNILYYVSVSLSLLSCFY